MNAFMMRILKASAEKTTPRSPIQRLPLNAGENSLPASLLAELVGKVA